MAPLTEPFPAHELPERVARAPPWPTWQPGAALPARNGDGSAGTAKKVPGSGPLAACRLAELVQYDCAVRARPAGAPGRIECREIVRLFRRYVVALVSLLLSSLACGPEWPFSLGLVSLSLWHLVAPMQCGVGL